MRDREATCRKIVDAVGRVLAAEGFRGVGLRSVAREAGVDKRLIYRYFGGLPKLMHAYAATGDFWWTVDELIGDDLPGPQRRTARAWAALALRRHVEALRRRPLTQEILVWELSERNALTDELSDLRERRAAELVARLGEKLGDAGPGVDEWRAVGALIVAATTYLVLRSRTCDSYAGIDLNSARGWEELERAIDLIVDRTFGARAPAIKARNSPTQSGAKANDGRAAGARTGRSKAAGAEARPGKAAEAKTKDGKAGGAKTGRRKTAGSKASSGKAAGVKP